MHSALEDHVRDAICPSCRKKSESEWKSEFWNRFHYISQKCSYCSYELFYKVDFMSCGVEK